MGPARKPFKQQSSKIGGPPRLLIKKQASVLLGFSPKSFSKMLAMTSLQNTITTKTIALLILLSIGASLSSQVQSSEPLIAGRSLGQWAEMTTDANRVVRLRAAKTLGAFGAPAKDALSDALSNPDAAIRYTAAVHLGRVAAKELNDATLTTLQRLAEDETQPAVQMAAAFALCRNSLNQQYLSLLTNRLDYPERGMSCSAAELLGMLGEDASAAVPALEKTFNKHGKNSEGDYHRGKAAQNALRKIVPGWEKPST